MNKAPKGRHKLNQNRKKKKKKKKKKNLTLPQILIAREHE